MLLKRMCIPIFSFVLILNVYSDDTIQVIEESFWPPFTYEKNGTPTKGIALDLADTVFSKLDIKFEMKLYPQNRMLKYLNDGTADVITVLSRNKDRDKLFKFSDPLFSTRGLVLYSADRAEPFIWEKYDDLKDYKIGLVSGYNYGENLNLAITNKLLKVEKAVSHKENLKKLEAGRIDLMFVNEVTLKEYSIINPEIRNLVKAAEKPFYMYNFHFAFSGKTDAQKLLPELNRVIHEIQNDGTLERIFSKYGMNFSFPVVKQ